MRIVRKTPAAERDIEDEYVHLALDSRDAGVRFLQRLDATFAMLAEFPGVGHVWRSKVRGARGVRVRTVRGFRKILVLYRRIRGGIEVLRVLHGARDIERIWESPADE